MIYFIIFLLIKTTIQTSEICIALGTKTVLRHTGSDYIIIHEMTFFPIEVEHLAQNLKTL